MHSLVTIQTLALTVAQERSLESFYQSFSDKNPSLLDEAVTLDWQDIPLAPSQGNGRKGFKPLMQLPAVLPI
jgi:hypothetical protein